jgi:MFS family permease
MIGWGRIADRIGRKPVLVFSLVGVAVASAMFGLAKHVWQMIVLRCVAGMFAGSIVLAACNFLLHRLL